MENIKIYAPIFTFYPYIGGAEKQAEKLFTHLVKSGIEVTVITAKLTDNSLKTETYNGIKIIRLPYLFNGKSIIFRKIGSFIFLLELFFYLILNHSKYDILQNFFIDKYTIAAALCGIIFKKPVIIREANNSKAVKSKENFNKSIQRVLYKLYRKTSAVIALNEEIKEELVQIFKFSPDKIHLIPNGVEKLEIISKAEARKKIGINDNRIIGLIIARLDPQKNHMVLFKAWKLLLKEFSDATLLCIGFGSEKDNYQKFIENNGCSENIILAGISNNVSEYYQAADFFILTSLYEGMSNALIEAMSLGLPCVVSNIKANRFLITHNKNGVLFDVNKDEENLANIIKNLINDNNYMKQLGNNAKIKVLEFSIDKIAEKYINLYKLLLYNTKQDYGKI